MYYHLTTCIFNNLKDCELNNTLTNESQSINSKCNPYKDRVFLVTMAVVYVYNLI